MLGIILRDQIITLLSRRCFEPRRAASPHLGSFFGHHAGPGTASPPLTADDFLRPWTQLSAEQIALSLSPEDMNLVVNLRPYVRQPASTPRPLGLHRRLHPAFCWLTQRSTG